MLTKLTHFANLNLEEYGPEIGGSFIGVFGAILTLFLAEIVRRKYQNRDIKDNFRLELKYLEKVIVTALENSKRCIEELSVGRSDLYFPYRSESILTISIQKAYSEGLIYKYLPPEQIAELNESLLFFGNTSNPVENYISNQLNSYKTGELNAQDLHQTLVWFREKAEKTLELVVHIQNKVG